MGRLDDLEFFATLVREGSLAGAAQALGLAPSSASKRLATIEARLGARLLHRTTRRMALTPEGETWLAEGTRVLAELEAIERGLAGAGGPPRGIVRLGASLGFGRRHVAPALSAFARAHAEVEVRLHLSDRPLRIGEHGLDLVILLGAPPDQRVAATRLAANRRLLCAAPAYLAAHGTPATPRALATHRGLFIREADEAFGTWHLHHGARRETVKVRGPLSANDGECALAWALDGHGIVLRSEWDVAPWLRAGRLVPVLPQWSAPPADVWLLGAAGRPAPRVRALADFLHARFRDARGRPRAW